MEDSQLSIRLLGGFEVRIGGRPMRSVRARSVEWLLTLLVLRHGRDIPRSWLGGTLWPESSEAQSLYNLRRNLMELRQVLGTEAARLRSPSRAALGLDLAGAVVDLVDFDAGIAAGDERSLQAAVALYRGPLLEGCSEEWVFPERASRAEACLQALETLADRAAERGDPAAALGYLGQAAALDPLRDSTQRRRMQALAADGDLPAALLTYREHRLRLHRELNVEPDAETTRLFQRLRAGRRGAGTSTSARPLAPSPSRLPSSSPPRPLAPSSPPFVSPAPLPRPLTALIGREQEVREVVENVRACRLVTLVGGGGVGKTRLAIQAAEELAADFGEGAAFIELATLTDPALLPATVAAALGMWEADTDAGAAASEPEPLLPALGRWLALHPVLLVLDNCEHLIEAAAALAHALLAACPALRILATSRQRLGLTGEVVWRVPSLPVPPGEGVRCSVLDVGSGVRAPNAEHLNPECLMQFASVRLFIERAAAVRPGFRLRGREDAVAVARICRRLDGIPLALELAAARAALLTLPQIAARLDDRFRLLTGGSRVALPRQQTLQALIDWSYHLLPETERALLGRLSVFAGGWTLEAAEAVCADFGFWILDFGLATKSKTLDDRTCLSDPIQNPKSKIQNAEVLDLLGALEEKSLVLVEGAAVGPRYRMLETVREYAREKLAASGELAAMRRRHRDWCLRIAEQSAEEAGRAAHGSGEAAWLARLESERENLWAALAWCREEADAELARGEPGPGTEAGLRLAYALVQFWMQRGNRAEGLQWLEDALARSDQAPPARRAPAFLAAAHLAFSCGRRDRHSALLRSAWAEQQKALLLARRSGTRAEVALAVLALAEMSFSINDMEAAWRLSQESREQMETLRDRVGVARALAVLAGVALRQGDREAARPLLEERLALCRELGEPGLLMHALGGLGHLARDEGEYAQARSWYAESLVLRRQAGYEVALAQSLEDLAALAGSEQNARRAVRLLGASEAYCETLGARPPVGRDVEYERTVAEGRAALGEAAFAAAWAQGRAMALEEAVEYALLDPQDPAA